MEALVEDAAKKAAVAWLSVPGGGPAYLVWCAWLGGALLVVSGPGEQTAPGLAEAGRAAASGAEQGRTAPGTAEVLLRGDHGGRIVSWPAEVSIVDPGSPEWAEWVPQLAAKRLNGKGGAEALVARWSQSALVVRLIPAGPLSELPDDAQAAPVRPTPATRRPKLPFRMHKVRGAPR